MNTNLLSSLLPITQEEQDILSGKTTIQKNLYTQKKKFIVDSNIMLKKGKLIDIRMHTRFIHFPKHSHNYIEILYMCSGSTTHIINGTSTINLKAGELLFLNQNATQEILPAKKHDVGVNFIILPKFFDQDFLMMEEKSTLHDFLISSLRKKQGLVDYLHFKVADVLPIQNLIENLIYSLINKQTYERNINQTTMGLLFVLLQNETDKMNQNDSSLNEQNIIFNILKYIEVQYKTGSLNEISNIIGHPDYFLSKLIKKHTGYTFKDLLQTKRLNQSAFLLKTTMLPVEDIIMLVGYDNSSYFYKIFKNTFHMTPKCYRLQCTSK